MFVAVPQSREVDLRAVRAIGVYLANLSFQPVVTTEALRIVQDAKAIRRGRREREELARQVRAAREEGR